MTTKPRRLREADIDRLGREAFITLFLASSRFTEEVEQLCKAEGIAMSHYVVLWFLSRRHAPDGVPMRAIIDGHLNRASDATRLADRLTALGLLERAPSSADRRVVLVRITTAGRDLFLRLTRQIKALHRTQWSHLDQHELGELTRLLAKALWGAAGASRHPLASDGAEG
jgi:DNA-binding MarR family transcriptional regulator